METRIAAGPNVGRLTYFLARLAGLAGIGAIAYQERFPEQLVPRLYELASVPAALSLPFLAISPFAISALRRRARAEGRRLSVLALLDLVLDALTIACLTPLCM